MILKKLDVYGFKSFADPTEFEFEPGVTAVVGPNGCGKSNVVDAIKWILGEQSARSLRGKEMLDVIFNGSGTRKSLGFAEASLTFEELVTADDKELPEVQITRRLYRSGESEYLINREGCRLRDIKELFLDTGVGMQAYSIIEQGRIDAILTRSPQDRRAIFEEAAGISRYKRKRLEAERKLERTEGNLLRVGDRIEEIERRLRSLKNQASKARRFREYETRLKELRVRHSLHQYAELGEQVRVLQGQALLREEEVASKREAASIFDAEVLEQEGRVLEIEAQLEDLSRARNEVDLKMNQAAADMEHGRAMIAQIEETTASHEREIQALVEHNRTDQVELEKLQTEHAAAVEGAAEARRNLEKARSEETALAAGIAERRRTAEGLARRVAELDGQRAELRDRLTQLGAQQAASEEHKTRLEGRRHELEEEINRLKSEREAQDAEVSRLADAIGEMTRTYHDREEAVRAAERQVESLGDALGRASEVYHSRLSRQELLRGFVDRHEGMAGGVQEVLRATVEGAHATAAVCGLVAEVVETDPEHYDAVEAALGHEAETIVCRDRDGGAVTARWLSATRAGKGKVVAADRLARPEEMSQRSLLRARALDEAGVLGDLRSRVRVGGFASDGARPLGGCFRAAADGRFLRGDDSSFRPVRELEAAESERLAMATVDELLGDVLVVQDLERAHALACRFPELRFVTPAGELAVRETLAVSAGRGDEAERVSERLARVGVTGSDAAAEAAEQQRPVAHGLVAQRNELRRLSEQVAQQARLLDEVKSERSRSANELAGLEEELQLLRSEIYDANIEHTEKRAAFRHFEQAIGARRRELEIVQEAVLSERDALVKLVARAEGMATQDAEVQRETLAAQESATHLDEEIAKESLRREELAESMRQLELAMTRSSEQTASLARAMRGLEAALAERRNRMERLEADKAASSTKIGVAQEGIREAAEKRVGLQGEREVLEGRTAEVSASRDAARARIDEVRAEVRAAREAVDIASEALSRIRLDQNEARVHADGLVERVRDEYGLELEHLLRRRLGLPMPPPEAEVVGEVVGETGELPGVTEEASGQDDGAGESGGGPAGEDGAPSDQEGGAEDARQDERESAFFAAEDDVNWVEVDNEIQELKRRMANLGNVNLEAIEEYDEVEKRFAELDTQRRDLTDAKGKLEQLIEELNVKSRDLFLSTLEIVRENFKDLFRKLFGGGNGDIILGEGDPLDAGIEIMAKPPGKEPANISLLSGGEKSMTAVALLFALFRSRPSPFCILDEVDAALDEANVTRFVGMLKDFLEETQFIIITHNKRTMSVADAIHGVTMQESGVSKRISVKFEEVA